MATYKETWDGNDIYELYRTLKRGAKCKRFMFELHWNILEHESSTSRIKAKESAKHFPKLKKSLMQFGKAFERARNDLIAATKNSDKS